MLISAKILITPKLSFTLSIFKGKLKEDDMLILYKGKSLRAISFL